MNILMLNPPFLPNFSRGQRSPAVTKSGTFYYPIWLSYATGVLEKEGFNVKLIDAPAQNRDLKDILEIVDKFQPNLTVIDTSTPSIYNDIKVGEKIKEVYPPTFLTLVGPHCSALPEETLSISEKIDALTRYEYDYTLRELAYFIKDKKDIEGVKGISFRRDGKIVHTPNRPYIENLDEIPFVSSVYKKHLDVKQYFYTICQYPEVTIITGRGCPFHCVYCMFPQTLMGHNYRARSAENVCAEFEYIKKEFPEVKEVFIEDDTLTINKKRTQEICNELIKRNNKLDWTANARADVDYETLRLMKKARCRLLCVGFESGDQNLLNSIKKNLTVEKAKQFVADAKKAGILIHGCFLLGNPGETKQTLETTLKYSKELNPDTAQFFPIMVYPGTEAYNWAKENKYLTTENFSEWLTDEGMHNCVVSRPGLTNIELVKFCDRARKEFYIRPEYILYRVKMFLLHPKESKRIIKSFKTFAKYLFRGTYKDK